MTSPKDQAIDEAHTLLNEYRQFLTDKAEGTRDAYVRTAQHMIGWVAQLPGNQGRFQPVQLTQTIVELYLTHLEQEGLSLNHRRRVKSTISNFAQFLIEEKGLLRRNPTRGFKLPPLPLFPDQKLSGKQRLILRSLVEQEGDRRGAALFALGYWAGFRVSDLSWLRMVDTHVGAKEGWLRVGAKESTRRDITLLNKARKPLYMYLQATSDTERTYVFISQRSERLTEEAIHYWFRTLKDRATKDQWQAIKDVTFNDLRQDFAQRAREGGWSNEEVAYYLGYAARRDMPVNPTPGGYTQLICEQIKEKLKNIKG
jgi:site-specific recombinase XerC